MAAHVSSSVPGDCELVQLGNEVNKLVNQEVRSIRTILGLVRPLLAATDISDISKRYGLNQALRYHHFNSVFGQLRKVINQNLSFKGKLTVHEQIFVNHLVASKCGFGGCGELAMSAAEKLAHRVSVFVIILVPQIKVESDTHAFLLLLNEKVEQSVHKLIKKEPRFERLFEKLPKDVVVVDPWLDCVFKVADLKTAGKEFLEFPDFANMYVKNDSSLFLEKGSKNFERCIKKSADACFAELTENKLIPLSISKEYKAFSKVEIIQSAAAPILQLITEQQRVWKLSLSRLSMFTVVNVGEEQSLCDKFREANIVFKITEVRGKPQVCVEVDDIDQLMNYAQETLGLKM